MVVAVTMAPRGGVEKPYALEDQVGHLLRRAHQRATAIFLERMGNLGLTPTQFAALVKISDEGMVSQNQLGRMTAMDPATSQGVIRRLEAQGLVSRAADPLDRRRTQLCLTDAGAVVVAQSKTVGREITRATLAPLDAAEQAALIRLLKKLG
jgi:DNA-binding MarR family transcriptional regulator